MTAATREQAVIIGQKAMAWAISGEGNATKQQEAANAKVEADKIQRYLTDNRGQLGLKEVNEKTAEYNRLVEVQQSAFTSALDSAADMQAKYDDMQNYIKSIVQTPAAEAPQGGFR